MSFTSIARAAVDPHLQARVQSAAVREAHNNPTFGDTVYGKQVTGGFASYSALYWAVANDTEAAYETALVAGRGAPGHDTDIITDANITAAVQAGWPADPTTTPVP